MKAPAKKLEPHLESGAATTSSSAPLDAEPAGERGSSNATEA
jgi:hypothetical protein